MIESYKISNKVTDELLKEMIELDNSVFEGQDVGDFSKCKEWLSANEDIYTVLLLDDRVVGYINFMPITDECYYKFRAGLVKDYQLTGKDILRFSTTQPLNCLLTSIVIEKSLRDGQAIKFLWDGFINKIQRLKAKIGKVILDCVTIDGENFAKRNFNAKFLSNSNGGKVYEGELKF